MIQSYIIPNSYQSQVCFLNSYWDMATILKAGMANWKFWRWIWPNFSRSSQIWQIMQSVTIFHSYQLQVCISSGGWNMPNWKFWRLIWPWPNFSRSNQSSKFSIGHISATVGDTDLWLIGMKDGDTLHYLPYLWLPWERS